MGLNYASFVLMKESGIIPASRSPSGSCQSLMLGRLKVTIYGGQRKAAVSRYQIPPERFDGFAENLLSEMGCTLCDSLDASDFEGSQITWNLNRSMAAAGRADLRGKYDLIFDYGTTEHIFNPPQSLANAMEMLRVGGRLNLLLPVTGWVDHGFYQFSPAFFYALESRHMELERCYFYVYDRKAAAMKIWDGLNPGFQEHIHGAFDGSYAANLFEFLNQPVNAWVVLRKKQELEERDFIENTNQLIYARLWKEQQGQIAKAAPTFSQKMKVFVTRLQPLALRAFLFRRILNSSRIRLDQVAPIGQAAREPATEQA